MEVSARLRHISLSPQKVRLVVDMIRGKEVQDAINILHLANKVAARPVEKLLRSAIANAENRQENVDLDRLYVKEVFVDGATPLKRVRPATMGRAFRILRRHSHITIKLDTRKGTERAGKA